MKYDRTEIKLINLFNTKINASLFKLSEIRCINFVLLYEIKSNNKI